MPWDPTGGLDRTIARQWFSPLMSKCLRGPPLGTAPGMAPLAVTPGLLVSPGEKRCEDHIKFGG